jgi:hypothetical protein
MGGGWDHSWSIRVLEEAVSVGHDLSSFIRILTRKGNWLTRLKCLKTCFHSTELRDMRSNSATYFLDFSMLTVEVVE